MCSKQCFNFLIFYTYFIVFCDVSNSRLTFFNQEEPVDASSLFSQFILLILITNTLLIFDLVSPFSICIAIFIVIVLVGVFVVVVLVLDISVAIISAIVIVVIVVVTFIISVLNVFDIFLVLIF